MKPQAALLRHAGFTLIEVMITVFVVAIGLLTVAGLQAASKRVSFEALQRTTAAALAVDLAERMRANPGALASYLTSDAATAGSSPDCAAAEASCSPTELAAYDLRLWRERLLGAEETVDDGQTSTGGLVSPTGCVTVNADGVYLVLVAWRGTSPLEPPDSSVPSNDPSREDCGKNLGRYDDLATAATDETMRRLVAVPVYVNDPAGSWK